MITQKRFKRIPHHGHCSMRWHRQSGWRMQHPATRRMQQNTHRWHCVHQRRRRETLQTWARYERNGHAACLAAHNRLPSNNDTPRAFVYWHLANVYARVALGEDTEIVLHDEAAQLLAKIRIYNLGQEKITHTWHGCAGYFDEDEVKTKMLHARNRMRTL